MDISLTPEQEAAIRAELAAGGYKNEAEVLRIALLRLREERERRERFVEAVAIGLEEIERGEDIAGSPRQLVEKAKKAARERHRKGEEIDSCVRP